MFLQSPGLSLGREIRTSHHPRFGPASPHILFQAYVREEHQAPGLILGSGARNCSCRRTAAIHHPWTCISGGPIGFPKVHHVPVSGVIAFEMSPRTTGLSLQGRTHSSQGCGLWLRPPAWPGVSPSNVRMGLLGLTLPGTPSCGYANRKRETELGHLLLSDSRSACECKARISADTHARTMHSS